MLLWRSALMPSKISSPISPITPSTWRPMVMDYCNEEVIAICRFSRRRWFWVGWDWPVSLFLGESRTRLLKLVSVLPRNKRKQNLAGGAAPKTPEQGIHSLSKYFRSDIIDSEPVIGHVSSRVHVTRAGSPFRQNRHMPRAPCPRGPRGALQGPFLGPV